MDFKNFLYNLNCVAYYDLIEDKSNKLLNQMKFQGDTEGTNNGADVSVLGKTFNGSSDYVGISDNNILDITTAPLSIFAWCKLSNSPGYCFCKNADSVATIQYGLFYDVTTTESRLLLEGVSRHVVNIDLNKWQLVGFTWDGVTVKGYIDGVYQSESSYSGTLTTRSNVNIGRRAIGAYFGGDISKIFIFQKTLTLVNINNLFKLTAPMYGLKV